MGVPGSTMGTIFTPVPSEMKSYKPESVAGEKLQLLTFSRLQNIKLCSKLNYCNHLFREIYPNITQMCFQEVFDEIIDFNYFIF